ncbi:unnamed protein product [Schistocephalus solidus]|uniref:Uncharacterized protein n=1 Tax=Schistocephalus solidus TaxID=70667 RepID=A0A183T8S1_SCHSO|nr:unnamed protein product [Schistocephalus solidus]
MPRASHDVAKIGQPCTAEALNTEIRFHFMTRADNEGSDQWSSLKTSVYGAAENILGCAQWRRSDRISGRTLWLSARTARARSHNDASFRQLRNMTEKSARDDRQKCWSGIVTYMEQTSNFGDARKLFQIIRQVSGEPSTLSGSVRDVNGGFSTDSSAKADRWLEHFEHLNFDGQQITPSLSSVSEFHPSPAYAVSYDRLPRQKLPMKYRGYKTTGRPEWTVFPQKSTRAVLPLWHPCFMTK